MINQYDKAFSDNWLVVDDINKKILQDFYIFPVLLFCISFAIFFLISNQDPNLPKYINYFFLSLLLILFSILTLFYPIKMYYDNALKKKIINMKYRLFNCEEEVCIRQIKQSLNSSNYKYRCESWINHPLKQHMKILIPINCIFYLIHGNLEIIIGNTYKDIDEVRKTPVYIGPFYEMNINLIKPIQELLNKSLSGYANGE